MSNGLELESMDASDMLDILHYYFEVDNMHASGEQAEAVSSMRTELYKLYTRVYPYGTKSSGATRSYVGANSSSGFDDPMFDPSGAPLKPFVPSTNFNPEAINPFGDVLDAPVR